MKYGKKYGVNMAYKVKYLPKVDKDISSIDAYLSQFYPGTAGRLFTALEKNIRSLRDFPYMGEQYKSYRRLIILDYQIFYRVNEEDKAIEIYRILHSSQNIEQLVK
jgi:addiction module RelE/StbE family toxin